jgi:DNA replication and repair protein RecF
MLATICSAAYIHPNISFMSLSRLKATNFRNFSTLSLELSPSFNLIYGFNGSGKTSILEAIYFLGLGRSFRSHLSNRVISYDAESFSIFSTIQTSSQIPLTIGIEKSSHNKLQIKIANQNNSSIADLAKTFPLLLINPESYQLIEAGPKQRRQFLDWGVFHVEHEYFSLWQRYQRVLKQRNAALQSNISSNQINAWNIDLNTTAIQLTEMRKSYLEKLFPLIKIILRELIDLSELSIEFTQGWKEEHNLQHLLETNLIKDKVQGYTQFGPHRADILIKIKKCPVQDVLSRGERKLLVIAMLLAQGLLLRDQTEKCCAYLLDDLAAELDANRKERIMKVLAELKSQVFITAVDESHFLGLKNNSANRLFHVEQGVAKEILEYAMI